MRSPGAHVLLKLLPILAALCCTGFSLTCYNCIGPVSTCPVTTNCSLSFDSCIIVVAGEHIYQQCWKFQDCKFQLIAGRLGLTALQYRCCQQDNCNSELKGNGATSLSGKMILLATSILAPVWNLFF